MTDSDSMDPLLLVDKDGNAIEQKLGKIVYRIDTSQYHARKAEHDGPMWKRVLKTTGMILATPVLIPTAALYTFSMFVGPQWWRYKVTKVLVGAFMKTVAELFNPERKELLQGIDLSDKLLDLGAGPGYYLPYLARGGHLVALEPCSNFHDNYKKRALEAGLNESQLEMHACTLETFVENNPQQMATFDWVILGNVLCEVDDQVSTLRCVDQLLKPGGRVYFSEHVGSPKGTWARTLQDLINPVWNTVGAGCNCNRDSLENIRNTPGWQVISWSYLRVKVGMGHFVLGLAKKQG